MLDNWFEILMTYSWTKIITDADTNHAPRAFMAKYIDQMLNMLAVIPLAKKDRSHRVHCFFFTLIRHVKVSLNLLNS